MPVLSPRDFIHRAGVFSAGVHRTHAPVDSHAPGAKRRAANVGKRNLEKPAASPAALEASREEAT